MAKVKGEERVTFLEACKRLEDFGISRSEIIIAILTGKLPSYVEIRDGILERVDFSPEN